MSSAGRAPARDDDLNAAPRSLLDSDRTSTPSVSLRRSGWNQPRIPWLTDAIVRYRRWLLVLSVVPFLLGFNGRWRIGLDSSIYRGLASSLLHGRGYHFGEFGTHQIYPGLPVMLAGLDRIFGEHVFRPVAPLVVILTMALLTLWVTYHLIGRHYPAWIAVTVTCGVALNWKFLQLSNELLTDVPFLLGLMMSLLGWDLLRAAQSKPQRTRAVALLVLGLLLAGSMRPTFWILAGAWTLVCMWGVARGPNRRFHGTCLIILLAVWALIIAVDP